MEASTADFEKRKIAWWKRVFSLIDKTISLGLFNFTPFLLEKVALFQILKDTSYKATSPFLHFRKI
jgi:hypothetical protein